MSLPTMQERVSAAEMQRRRTATRAAMARRNLDGLLVSGQGPVQNLGHLRYLTNWSLPLFEEYFLLPLTGEPIYFSRYNQAHNPMKAVLGLNVRSPQYGAGLQEGRLPGSVTSNIPPGFVAAGIRETGVKRLGICGVEAMAADFYVGFVQELEKSGIAFERASDLLFDLRMIKSREEQGWVRKSAAVGSYGFEVFKGLVAPGKREYEVFATVDHAQRLAGAEMAFYMTARGWEPQLKFMDHAYETYAAGDTVFFNTETCGPGGYYIQMIRTLTLGKADDEVRRGHAAALAAQEAGARKLVPGNRLSDVYKAVTSTAEQLGYDTRAQHPGHSQGLDIFEPPLISAYDDTIIQAGMYFVIHPGLLTPSGRRIWMGDPYLVTETGAERISTTSTALVEIT